MSTTCGNFAAYLKKIMQNEEQGNCAQSISYGLNRTADWRDKVFTRYHDQRNVWASNALRKLAADAPGLTTESWEKLEPYFEWGSERFREAVSQTARQVGFQHKSRSFPFFIKNLAYVLQMEKV